MKKRLLLSILLAVTSFSAFAGTNVLVPTDIVNQNFDGAIALPTGWSVANDANYSLFGTGGWYNLTTPSNSLNVTTASSSKNQGVKITFPSSGSASEVYTEFDWTITTATVGRLNALGLILRDNVAAAYTNTGDILILYCSGTDGKLHCQNINNTLAVFQDLNGNGSFLKSGTDNATCDANNASTITTCGWAVGQTLHIKAILNFSTYKISYIKLTNKTTGTFYENTSGLNFLSGTAANISKICITNTRISASGNGSNSVSNTSIDNFQTYTAVDVSATASVTIKYIDQLGNPIKSQLVISDQGIGSNYAATSVDKQTFIDNTNGLYYAYDATSTATNAIYGGTGDTTFVRTTGSTITLRFKKSTLITSNYKWTGSTSANLNEIDNNFTTDDVNSIGYQTGNALEFPEIASNKTIALIKDFDLGSNNFVFSGSGYSLIGNKTISGTGSLIVNPGIGNTTTLSLFDTQTQGVNIQSGTASINGVNSGTRYTMSDGAKIKLNTGADFSKAIIGTGTITIEAATSNAYSPTITGATTINVIQDVAGALSSSTWYPSFTSTMPTGSQVNVSTSLASASYAIADGSLANAKVNLGSNIRLLKSYNQSDPSSTHTVGELTGESTSTIEGGFVSGRTLNYNIGGLNTNATFNGKIKNYRSDAGDVLNINKIGAGTWTLTGASESFTNGSFNVNFGKVVMNGSIASTTLPVAVASGATLSGIGTIGGATTINGTLEGKLNFGSSLTLVGTTKINVTGFNSGDYDVVNVTGAVSQSGSLEINVSAAAPAVGTKIKIINAGSYIGTISLKGMPDYNYDAATGELTYIGSKQWSGTGNWSTTANWQGASTPLATENILVADGDLTIDQNVTVNDMTINPGAKVTLANGSTLTVSRNLFIYCNTIEPGTFVDLNTTGGLTVTGTTTVQRYLTGAGDATPNGRHWYISSPVTGATSGALNASGPNRLWSYSEATQSYTEITSDATTFTVGQGYVARLGANITAKFIGALNTGDKSIAITRTGTTSGYRGFNLIGNPYPSFLDWSLSTKSNILPTMWLRTRAGSIMTFDTYNADLDLGSSNGDNGLVNKYIPPMQAFWVKRSVDGTSGNIVFTNSMRSHQTANLLRSTEVDSLKQVIRLRVSNGKYRDEAILAFHKYASDSTDRFDSPKMRNNIDSLPEICLYNGKDEMVINGMKRDDSTRVMKVGFRTGKRGKFTITATELSNLEAGTKVILKDNLLKVEQDLMVEPIYEFTSEVAETADRFTLMVIKVATGINTETKISVVAFGTSNGQIQVNMIGTADNLAKINVHSLLGQEVGAFSTNSANTLLNKHFATGIYLVTVEAKGVLITKKVVVNQ